MKMSGINKNKNQYQSDDYDAITRWSKSFVFYPEKLLSLKSSWAFKL